jgi:heat-inducible transcriptional repressor
MMSCDVGVTMTDPEELNPRESAVLRRLVVEFIETGDPVGSTSIARAIDCSPATIRSTMVRLVERGFLIQPHISAGRVPTTRALRTYVDRLVELVPVAAGARDALSTSFHAGLAEANRPARAAGRTLGDLTSLVGIASPPKLSSARFRHIDFVHLDDNRIIVIWVDDLHTVYNQVVRLDSPARPSELQQIANYLNEVYANSTFAEVCARLEAAIDADQAYVELIRRTAEVWRSAFVETDTKDVFIERPTNLLALNAFADRLRLRGVLEALEEKKLILDIIQNLEGEVETQVFVGLGQADGALEQCSLIVAPYRSAPGEQTLGWVGVVGPTRISYRFIIPVVECVADEVSRILSEESAA